MIQTATASNNKIAPENLSQITNNQKQAQN